MNVPARNCAWSSLAERSSSTAAALGDPAAHLTLDDRRVDELPAVLDDDPALDVDVTGLDVDLDDGAVRAARPAALPAVEHRRDLEVGIVLRRRRDLGERLGAHRHA